ncbi:MAG: sigma-70 family RNA polymerase sigma factor [Deltaproteobacteria bacterium]|nr:sigma-70 family RNA polymerase sigma factor [Deltaproteobacteria bacterium]
MAPSLSLVKPIGGAVEAGELPAVQIVRAAAGDAAATRALVLTYQRRLFAYVARMLGRDRAAYVEDACQTTLLKAFRALPSFEVDGPAKLSTWLFTIATRVCIDELRKPRRLVEPLDDDVLLAASGDVAGAPASAEAVAIERALRRRVERAVAALPPDLRATFVLRVVAELDVKETARALEVDDGTVKSRLSRARDQIRAYVGEV